MESILTLLGIYFLCWFKFLAGPVLGSAAGYSVWQNVLVTVAGMMTSVVIFTLVGTRIKDTLDEKIFTKPKLVFSKKNRRIVQLWKKYGEIGIALFTPILLSPIGGTLIMVSFGVKKRHIYFHMFWSACFWAVVFSLSIDHLLAVPFIKNLFL
ncbi:small multi-drug export protein [Algoriphagus aquimarinus]|uniref:Small multi-drug export protein n=1 Tax=Algoriphagus aquimarinus TaxID=237018 RepID=A0A1I0WKW4_9BACT|nr:small multi-drug export protein [Algoriphagus aquimarinus]SFA88858.1 hypothetical protein SAMN04489723_102176 [Algoriphagus aquimarinus]|tara:strand:+ start:65091 stop:65549 length:459 start_codon:yes stop_codon:yes gene_type:complete